MAAGQGQGLGHRRVLDAARARRPSASTARRRKGKQSGRTQEIQRLIGRSLRAVTDLAAMGERADHRRLRRAPGRRRHPHRVDLRRLHRAARRAARRLVATGKLAAHPLTEHVRRDLGRRRRRHADARPRLLRGRARRGRHERRDDRRRAASSRCRAPPRASPFTRGELDDAARPGRGRHRRDRRRCSARCSPTPPPRPSVTAPVDAAARSLATGQPRQGARDRAPSSATPASSCVARARPSVPDVEETGDTLEEQRPAQGGRARATPPALPAVADDTGLEVDALGGAPGVYSARYAARTPPTPTTWPSCSPSSTGVHPARPHGPVPHGGAGPLARRARGRRPTARSRAHRRPRRGATAASATTRCSCPTEGDGRTFAEMTADEKHAHLATAAGPSAALAVALAKLS